MENLAYPLTGALTLLCLLVYFWTGIVVARARSRLGVRAPATTGPDEFNRIYRAHVNTHEQIVMFLPAAWLFALTVGDCWAALAAAVWCAGRVLYVIGYARAAEKRELGFALTALPMLTCLLGSLGVILWHFVA